MATMNIWWHRALPRSGLGGGMPIVQEPEISKTTVITSGTAAASSAAPEGADVAVCKSTAATYYRVRRAGDTDNATNGDKQIAADTERDVHVLPGDTISFIE